MSDHPAQDPQPTLESVLLDEAERQFSARGYDGVSVRDITEAAGVNVGAISYYFGGKAALFRAVLERRVIVYQQLTLDALAAAKAAAAPAPPGPEAVATAFVRPPVELIATGGPGWRAFLRLQSSIASLSGRPEFTAPIYDRYRVIHTAYLEALRDALPGWSDTGARWGFYMLQLALNGFVNRDHPDAGAPEWHPPLTDPETVIARIAKTFAAGFEAAAAFDPAEAPAR